MRMRSIADFGCTKRARKGQGFLGAETRSGSSFRSSWFLQAYRLEKTDETGSVDIQSIEHILHGSVDRRSLPLKRVRNKLGVEVIQIAEKRTRPHYGDRIGLQRCSGEILYVVGDDDFRIAPDGGGQDMPILGMVCHDRNEILVAFHPRFREVPPDFTLSVGDLLIRQLEVLREAPVHFAHDLIGPLWQVQFSPAGEPQQRIRQRHRDEDAGVQNDFGGGSHPTLSLITATFRHHVAVVQPSFKCLPGKTVESSLTFFVALAGEFKNVS